MRIARWQILVITIVIPVAALAQSDPYEARRLEESKKRVPVNEANLAAGKQVYLRRCAMCHGDEGRGDGGAAPYLDPRPRDFTRGLFKFRSTRTGELPTDEDLFRTVSRGVPGTAMPAWGEPPFVLPEKERWQAIYYVKQLSTEDFTDPDFSPYDQRIPISPAPRYSADRVAAGKIIYSDEKKGACVKCHGNAGRGDGKEAGTQKDDWGDAILPVDLTRPWNYKNGASVPEIFRTLSTGMNGTPMPGYAETMSESQRWDLACFVKSLHIPLRPGGDIVLVARKQGAPLPMDPADPFWAEQEALDIPMGGQVVVTPRHRNATIKLVSVRAAYNEEEVAFHFSWDDRFEDTAADTAVEATGDRWVPELQGNDGFVRAAEMWARRRGGFTDRLQIQFPVKISEGSAKPFFFMGNPGDKVNLWTWQAGWSANPAAHGGTIAEERNAAGYKRAPSRQGEDSQALSGRAVFEDGRWRLVLKRPRTTNDVKLDVQLEPGVLIPFALQAWDGGNGEEGLLCAISSWYYVALEGRTDPTGYVWAVIGVLLTLGGETLAVRQARKHKGTFPAKRRG